MSSPSTGSPLARPLPTRLRDAVLISDLGLVRLYNGLRTLLCVPAGMLVGWLVSLGIGLPASVGLTIGALPPFLMGFIITGDKAGRTAARSGAVVIPFLIGLFASLALQQQRIVELVLLIVLLFAQFYAPRFSQWAGDATAVLFAAFLCGLLLPLPLTAFWDLALIGAAASAAAIGITALLLRRDPERMLRQVRRAFTVHAGAVLALAAEALAQPVPSDRSARRARRRLRLRLGRLHESALVADGLIAAADPGADARAETLHRLLFDTESAVGGIGRVAGELAASDAPPSLRERLADALRAVTARGFGHSGEVAKKLAAGLENTVSPVEEQNGFNIQRLIAALGDLADVSHRWRNIGALADSGGSSVPFSSPVVLAGGRIAGPGGVVEEALSEASGTIRRRISAPLRTALQAAVAVAVVEPVALALDGPRFYWAVIGVLVVMAGTNSTRDRLRKTWNRIIGTVIGGVVGIVLVDLLGAHHVGLSILVIVVAMVVGTYSFSAQYAIWVAALVVLLCQVYVFAGGFDDELIAARLGLNALGGVAAILAGALILPVSTGAMARTATQRQLRAVREFVEDLARAVRGGDAPRLRADAREVDVAARHLDSVLKPLVRVRTGSRPSRDDEVRTALEAVTVHVRRLAALGDPAPLADGPTAARTEAVLSTLAASIGELERSFARTPTRRRLDRTRPGSAGDWHRVSGRVNELTAALRAEAGSAGWRHRLQFAGRIDETLAALAERERLTVHGDAEPLAVTRALDLSRPDPDASR